MSNFNPNKLWINYRLSNLNQIQPRRYTLTHSDETGELFLVIGSDLLTRSSQQCEMRWRQSG